MAAFWPCAWDGVVSGRSDVMTRCAGLEELAQRQSHACSRRQLALLGVDARQVQGHLRARRWQLAGPQVLVLHTGPLSEETRLWTAVLNAGPKAALCAWTALAVWGLTGWQRPRVHLVVGRGCDPPALELVCVHESRRHLERDVRVRGGIRLHSVERAALDVAAWSRSPRTACGLLAAVVQQGLSTPTRLLEMSTAVGRVQHLRPIQLALCDIDGGARAMSEIDIARLCRGAGLAEPVRQARRRDAAGRWRYLDVEWRLGGGRRVLLEIDGIGHMEVERWYDDLLRAAEIGAPGETMLRLPATAARLEPARTLAILRRHLT